MCVWGGGRHDGMLAHAQKGVTLRWRRVDVLCVFSAAPTRRASRAHLSHIVYSLFSPRSLAFSDVGDALCDIASECACTPFWSTYFDTECEDM